MQQPLKDELLYSAFYTVFRRKWLIVWSFLLILCVILFSASLITLQFDATAQVKVDLNPRYQVVLFPDFSQPSGRSTMVDPAIGLAEILTNRDTACAAVETFGLGARLKERKEDSSQFREVTKRIFRGVAGGAKSLLSAVGLASEKEERTDEWWNEQAAQEFVDDWNRIDVERETSMLNVTILAPDHDLSREICAWMVDRLRNVVRQHTRDKFIKMQSFVHQNMVDAEATLAGAAEELRTFLEGQDPSFMEKERDFLLSRQGALQVDVVDARASHEGARLRLLELRKQLEGQDVRLFTSEEVEARNPTVSLLKTELRKLEGEMAALATQLKEDHPQRKEQAGKIDATRKLLDAEVKREFQSTTKIEGFNPIYLQTMLQMADAVSQEAMTEARVTGLQAEMTEIGGRLKTLASELAQSESVRKDLDRKVNAAEAYYLQMQKGGLELNALAGSPEGEFDLTVVDPVHNPDGREASTPEWDLVFPIAFVVAVFFALFIAFFLEYWRSTFRNSWEFEVETGTEIMVTVPHIKKSKE